MQQATGKESRIELITDVEDLRPYRKEATIFINPMRLGSGLRIKILEAMGSGLPVVTTSLGAAGLPAQNGVNCLINDTPDGFANAISWLLTDTQLATRIGTRAKQMTSQQYNVHASTSHLERIFNDTINSAQQAKTS
jgi:glycosyltransferase involved in cell wall biosynthesis